MKAYLIDDAGSINLDWFEGINRVGLTAGASAPEKLVKEVIRFISKNTNKLQIQEIEGEPENMVFALPKELRLAIK